MKYQVKALPDNFSAEIYNSCAIHPLQTWEWGEFRKSIGTKIMRLGIFEKDQLKDVILVTIHPLPYIPFNIAYIPRSSLFTLDIWQKVIELLKRFSIIFIKIEPYELASEKNVSLLKQFEKSININRSPHQLFPDWTMMLDLKPDEDTLLKETKSKTRYNIRLATKKGAAITIDNSKKGFEIFQKLYFETCKRQQYFGHNVTYHLQLWKYLRNKVSHIMIAWYKGEPLAAYVLFLWKDRLYYPFGGSSDKHRNVMAANLIMWETIKFGKKHNAKIFDMWGSAAPDRESSDLYSGFTRFKEGYNAKYTQMIGSFDIVIKPTLYNVYNMIYILRYKALELKASLHQ